jgi:hypothetical protein
MPSVKSPSRSSLRRLGQGHIAFPRSLSLTDFLLAELYAREPEPCAVNGGWSLRKYLMRC